MFIIWVWFSEVADLSFKFIYGELHSISVVLKCTVTFGVYIHPLVQYIRSKSRGGGVYAEFVQNIPSIRPCATLLCTKSMHLQSSLQCPLRYVCTAAHVDVLAYTYTSEEIYCTCKPESWYKLQGGHIPYYKLPLCKTLTLKWGTDVYSRVCLYSACYSTCFHVAVAH